MNWLALAIAYLALAAFALAMEAHHHAVFARPPTPTRRRFARLAGTSLLAASGAVSATHLGLAHGLAFLAVATAAGGFALALVLALRPRWWPLPALASALAALAASLSQILC